jgi:transcriptional regulator with XRE-family HTH domain
MPSRDKPDPTAMRIADRIRKLHRASDLPTIEQLAFAAELSKGHLSRILSGRCLPSIPTMQKLAEALDVKLSDLLSDNDDGASHGEPAVSEKHVKPRMRVTPRRKPGRLAKPEP